MKRKTNPDIHIICGKCGYHTEFSYNVDVKGSWDEDRNVQFPAVYLSCGNCGTLTGLDEIITDKTKY